MAEFLSDHPIDGPEDLEFEFPDEGLLQVSKDTWELYFDSASNQNGYGNGILLLC